MKITVNGETVEVDAQCSVAGLLKQLGLGEKRVAVERNGELVPKSLHVSEVVSEGDRIEIVQAIGGG